MMQESISNVKANNTIPPARRKASVLSAIIADQPLNRKGAIKVPSSYGVVVSCIAAVWPRGVTLEVAAA